MLKITTLVLVFLCVTIGANAQKLPNIQQASLRAPADIKIDGRATEWNDKFQAYNHATEVFYTVSNDDANLYLAVQSNDSGIIQKIVAGGITFTIKSIGKKNTVSPVAVTYPLIPDPYSAGVGYILRTHDTMADTDLIALNKQVSGHIKEIRVTGVKEIPDSAVSVYNDQGIRAAGLVDNRKAYTCELAVPLKYLQQVVNSAGTFSYVIQVNGLDGTTALVGHDSNAISPQTEPVDHSSSYFLFSPTYFGGEYTLAKK
jgi:hypothetical protein